MTAHPTHVETVDPFGQPGPTLHLRDEESRRFVAESVKPGQPVVLVDYGADAVRFLRAGAPGESWSLLSSETWHGREVLSACGITAPDEGAAVAVSASLLAEAHRD